MGSDAIYKELDHDMRFGRLHRVAHLRGKEEDLGSMFRGKDDVASNPGPWDNNNHCYVIIYNI